MGRLVVWVMAKKSEKIYQDRLWHLMDSLSGRSKLGRLQVRVLHMMALFICGVLDKMEGLEMAKKIMKINQLFLWN
jgi:hypothetical protein